MTPPSTVDDLLALFDEAFIDQLYRTLLGREPDPMGRMGHIEQLRRDCPKDALIAHFALSAEGLGHGARLDGLAELCTRSKAPDRDMATRWLAARAQGAGLVSRADVATVENRLGRQLQALQGKVDTALARPQSPVTGAAQATPAPTPVDANTAELYRSMVQLGQSVARLGDRLDSVSLGLERAERQVTSAAGRQRAGLEEVLGGIQASLARIEALLQAGAGPKSGP